MIFTFDCVRRVGTVARHNGCWLSRCVASSVICGGLPADGTVTGDTEKKMTGFILKIAGVKDAPPADKLYDFSLVRKAHLALQAKGWQPGP